MPYRTYSSPGGQVVNGVAYIYDPSLVVGEITGNFRPAITSDFAANISVSGLNLTVGSVAVTGGSVSIAGGSVAVSNTAPIPISGVVQSTTTVGNIAVTGGSISLSNTAPIAISGVVQTNATFDSTSIVNAQITGNNINVVSNALLSGISGTLISNTQRSSWVTGQVSLTNTAPIAISGVVQSATTIESIAVTGGSINISNTAPLAISGIVQTNATFDSTSIVNAQVSGNNINIVGNSILSGISGLLDRNVNATTSVTGAVEITNTAPIAISGVVQTTTNVGSVAVTGGSINVSNTAPIAISGVVQSTTNVGNVAVTGGSINVSATAPLAISGVVQTTATIGNIAVTGGSVNVSNTAPIAISGVVQASLDPTSIVNAQASGNNINIVSNALLSGISGVLISNPQRSSWVTGQVSLTNTAPIAISGVVQATTNVGNVAVTGGSINVSNTAPIAISGVVQTNATFDSTSIVNAQITGNNIANVSNVVLSGISGLLGSSLSDPAWVTGQVSLANTAPIAISGVVQATTNVGNVAVTGGSINVSNTAPIAISGVVQTNATFDSTSIVNAQITGNNINLASNVILSGISGVIASNPQRSSWVTGQVSLTNTAPLAISGVVQTSATVSSVAVTGGFINVSNTAPIAISGVVQTNATFDSTSIVNAQVTGNNINTITNSILSGVSGLLSTTFTTAAWVTGAVGVTNTAPIAISGVVQTNATFDSTSIVNAQITGNTINTISNTLLSGISGVLATNPQRSSWVTGQVSLTNTAPIAISGVVQTTTTVGNVAVTGGFINVSNTAPIAISGVVQASLDSAPIVNAQASGNNISAISNALLSGVSGLLSTTFVTASWVTGNVGVTNTAPIAISGVVQTTATIGNVAITGGSVNVSNTAPLPISGVVQTSIDSTPIVNAQITGNNINAISNVLLSGVSGLLTTVVSAASWVTGNVGITNTAPIPVSGVVVSSAAATPTTASTPAVSGINNAGWGVALGTNASRRAWGIQNLSTGVIRVNFSSTLPSTGAAHLFLKGGSAQNDGLGAAYIENPAFYAGPVSISGDFNVSPAYTIWQV